MNAIGQLKEEHRAVEVMIHILEKISQRLEKGESVSPEHLKSLSEFISVFIEKCHHKKEEGYLFPLMLGSDDIDSQLVKKLIEDHMGFYRLIGEIVTVFSRYEPSNPKTALAVVDIIHRYIPTLKSHATQEDKEIFPLVEKYLPKEVQEKMYQDFVGFEARQIGSGQHEKFHQMLDELKKVYLS